MKKDKESTESTTLGRMTKEKAESLFYNNYMFKKIFNVYFWERDSQSTSRGGAEREGDAESEAGSRLWTVNTEPEVGLKLTEGEIMTWTKVRRLTDWATQSPLIKWLWCSLHDTSSLYT